MIEVHIPTLGERIIGLEKKLVKHSNVRYLISHQNYQCVDKIHLSKLLKREDIKYHEFDGLGVAANRNNLLNKSGNCEIILFSDDDVLFSKNIFQIIIKWFNSIDTDFITFPVGLKNSKKEMMIPYPSKRKRLNLYNCGKYGTINLAIKSNLIKTLRFDPMYGPGSKFMIGEDFIFITDLLKLKYKGIYEPKILVYHDKVSTGVVLSRPLVLNRLFLFRRVYGWIRGTIVWVLFVVYKYNFKLFKLLFK